MNDIERLKKLRADFAAGRISREEFWTGSAMCYGELREHTPLDPAGPIKSIHADGDALILELRNGLFIGWNPEDVRTAPNWILNYGTYEPEEMATLDAIAEHSDVVFDIGANIGWYTLHLADRMRDRRGHVYAFEPIASTFATLHHNVALNTLDDWVTMSPFGLGDADKSVEFFVPALTGSVAASQRQLIDAEANTKVSARIKRLDDVADSLQLKRLDFIKCDIEGGELLMLKGGARTIERFKPVLFLELLRKWSKAFGYHPNDVIELLEKAGYRCWAIAGRGLERLTRMHDDTRHTNFLFLQESHEHIRFAVDGRLRSVR